ncbi:MAG: DUF6036 family nucleotidyltransferase [Myxococcota bacterium]
MIPLDEKVARLAKTLRDADVPHAFGGAIALAYYATPRGTVDVDVNVFLPARDFDRVLAALAPLGVEAPSRETRRHLARDEQVRLFWERTPLDLFFSYTELHDACLERRRRVPFGGDRLHILSAEDLAIFKVLFARDKDWRDLAEMRLAQGSGLDAGYVTGWLERIVPDDDERLVRYRSLFASAD